MNGQQIQGAIRWAVNGVSWALAARGLSQLSANVTGALPYIEACIGPVGALGAFVWQHWMHNTSNLASALAKSKDS